MSADQTVIMIDSDDGELYNSYTSQCLVLTRLRGCDND